MLGSQSGLKSPIHFFYNHCGTGTQNPFCGRDLRSHSICYYSQDYFFCGAVVAKADLRKGYDVPEAS